MGTVSWEQLTALTSAVESHDFLRRLVDAIEQYHRLVFYSVRNADWNLVRDSARQILIAEIVTRHAGNIDGIYHALRAMEHAGRSWSAAITELAGRIHSYYTTPLGVVLRKDLFGERAVFITPDAHEWIRRHEGVSATGATSES